MEEQVRLYAVEVESQGWGLEGPESTRLFWELLTPEMKRQLKQTSCYRAIQNETQDTFRANPGFVPASRFSGLAAALREHFGGRHGTHDLGTALASHTSRATSSRIKPLRTD